MAVDMTTQSIAVGDNWVKVGNDYVGDKPNGATSGGTAALAWSAPSGLADGNTLTITTDGTNPFGSGCANIRFENFSSLALDQRMESGSIFDNYAPFWSAYIRNDHFRSSDRAGQFIVPKKSDGSLGSSINGIDFVGGADEVFVSYATQVPSGAYMPGGTGGNSGTNADYSNDSAWKVAWLLGPDRNSGLCDLVIPTLVGDSWSITGNDLGNLLTNIGGDAPSWWKFGAWNRMSTFLKAGNIPQTDAGTLYFQVANGQEAISEFNATPVIFANADSADPNFIDYKWYSININGWWRSGVGGSDGLGTGVDFRYDDIYVAWGDNAAARVELGNNANYTACTDLALCKPTSWANGQIELEIKSGAFSLSESLWLHITLADNLTRYSIQVS